MKVCDVDGYPLNLPPEFLAASGFEPVSRSCERVGGRYLIEASAGTGKTYTITHLILRLVLMGVPVRKILVTTFSKAAADELKTRILRLLNKEFRKRESNTKPGSSAEMPLFDFAGTQKERFFLQLAVSSIDEMTVSTIHGFCQKMLGEYALKSGNGFETELVPDESEYRDRLIRRFCRNRFYGGDVRNRESFETLRKAAKFSSEPIDRDCAEGEALDEKQTLCREVCRYVGKELQAEKDKDGVISYDDIIRDFDAVLQKDDSLAESIRSQYMAVFVDEFQDTDRLQYRIFDKCFPKGCPNIFYMIGDPKQAIYGFRGADIYTYLQAKNTADDQFTLTKNFRSSPDMIEAVNRMFSDGDLNAPHETDGVFLQKDIPFVSIEPGGAEGFPDNLGGSLCLRHYIGTKGDCAPGIMSDVVREIRYLLSEDCPMQVFEEQDDDDDDEDGEEKPKLPRRLRASDIAILVQTHDQAAELVKRLNAEGIAASACKSGKIYDTDEAKLMLLLLRCFLHPDMPSVRGLMLSPFFRFSGDDVVADSTRGESLLKQMAEYGRIWTQSGLPAAFLQFLDTPVFDGGASPRIRILSEFNGERAITNLIQLMELFYQKEAGEHLLPEDILNSLNLIVDGKAESSSTDKSEDNPDQLRLDRDSASVQILTMFAAKGLGFPVVFVPYPAKTDWKNMQQKEVAYRINTAAQNAETPETVLDFGKSAENQRIARQEEIRNSLRLLYVSLTRASLVTYLYTQQLSEPNGRAINYVNSAQGVLLASHRPSETCPGKTVVEQLWDSGYFEGTGDILPQQLADWWNELNEKNEGGDAFRTKRNGVFERHFGKRSDIGPLRKEDIPENLKEADFSGKIQDTWSIMSFSSFQSILNKRADVERETPADLDEQNVVPEDESEVEAPVDTGVPADLSSDRNLFRDFPHGTAVGSMTHKLLENCAGHFDLFASGRQENSANKDAIENRIAAALREYGFDPEDATRKQQLLDGVTRTLQIPLPKIADGNGIGIPLSEIRQDKMAAEMEFFLDAPDSLDLERILATLADTASEQARPLIDRKNVSHDGNGILNGIIDLIFEHDGKYYIVDWKTNWLGASDADYSPGRIRATMGKDGYVLQSCLYAAALLRFLRLRGKDYDAFGGVYYIFLRGLSRGTQNGIWFDVPPQECLEELLSLFRKEGV